MAKNQTTIATLIGKKQRLEGELEAVLQRQHDNMARCFDSVLEAVQSQKYSKILLGGGRGSTKSSAISLIIVSELEADERACALVLRKVGNTIRGSVYEQI